MVLEKHGFDDDWIACHKLMVGFGLFFGWMFAVIFALLVGLRGSLMVNLSWVYTTIDSWWLGRSIVEVYWCKTGICPALPPKLWQQKLVKWNCTPKKEHGIIWMHFLGDCEQCRWILIQRGKIAVSQWHFGKYLGVLMTMGIRWWENRGISVDPNLGSVKSVGIAGSKNLGYLLFLSRAIIPSGHFT